MLPSHLKLPGLAYALDAEGRELPVIDVSHPAFSLAPSASELESRTAAAIASMREFALPSSEGRRAAFALQAKSSWPEARPWTA